MKTISQLIGFAALGLMAVPAAVAETVPATTGDGIIQMSELDGLDKITYLAGEACRANRSTKGNPITIMGTVYESGVGTHAPSVAVVELNGATSFHAVLGVDDGADVKANHGIVDYVVTLFGADATQTTEVCSGTLNRQTESYSYTLDIPDLSGYAYLKLEYAQGAQPWADHADWADARFTWSGTAPRLVTEREMFSDGSNTVSLPAAGPDGEEVIALSSLDLTQTTCGWSKPKVNKSIDNNPLTINGVVYESGVGTHATAKVVVKLNGATTEFHSVIGIDDEANNEANVNVTVSLRGTDGKLTEVASGNIRKGSDPVVVDATGLAPYRYLIIDMNQNGGNSNDHVDIANAYFLYKEQNSNRPEIVNESVLNTSLFAATEVFSQPGVKFMQKLRCQADGAVISVADLPAGLTFNAERCLVEGIIENEGTYTYTVNIAAGEETTSTPVTLTVSSDLAMPTPLMGWLSWNVVQGEISNKVVEDVTDNMVNSGLRDAGYNYIIIDDLWHASARADGGKPKEDPAKFPKGMKAAADYVHAAGMKFGNYSDVAERTCAGAFGSIGYEEIDAAQYKEWGIDITKVDYCGAPGDQATARERYGKFGSELAKNGILLYMCEWGVREPWKWATETGAAMWRATYDTRDCWNGATGGIGILQSIEGMKDIWPYNGVNRWNDADMMCVGIHGTGKSSSDLCASGAGMTMDEYRTQFALWCMWSSPLTLSFDLRKEISKADLELMTNPELIAINQDRMGQAGEPLLHDRNFFVMAKDLENGDVALSVTNLSAARKSYTFNLAEVPGLDGNTTYTVRDLQKQEACPEVTGTLEVTSLPKHATAVYRLSKQDTDGINEIGASQALGNMTATADGDSVRVCLPGTEGVAKRLLVSDVEGRVLANAAGTEECFALPVGAAKGLYVINAICAGRSHSVKVTL